LNPDTSTAATNGHAVVVIGRNEGERLRLCLASVLARAALVVYVDSGSTDGSPTMATAMGAVVVPLDMSIPFTAARARNEGFREVRRRMPDLTYVQFVDGDCEVDAAWMDVAKSFLDAHTNVAAVCGRRRERFPERSVFNRLCDAEWDTPIGETKSCGGDVLMRAEALTQAGGYRDDMIAGEEPELCVRMRKLGWKVWRIDAEMTLHDAAMTRWSQWWWRTVRTGHAFAEGVALHGAPPERHRVHAYRSAWTWGVAIPLAIVVLSIVFGPLALLGLLLYPTQVLRIAAKASGPWGQRTTRAFFLVLGKFPEAVGQIKFLWDRRSGATARIIEYK
jgi:GT2 family glycosyltransferase